MKAITSLLVLFFILTGCNDQGKQSDIVRQVFEKAPFLGQQGIQFTVKPGTVKGSINIGGATPGTSMPVEKTVEIIKSGENNQYEVTFTLKWKREDDPLRKKEGPDIKSYSWKYSIDGNGVKLLEEGGDPIPQLR